MRRLTRITNGSRTKNLRRGDKMWKPCRLTQEIIFVKILLIYVFATDPSLFFNISDLDANFIQSMKLN